MERAEVTVTRLLVLLPGESGGFGLWKAESGGRTGCAVSQAAARARLQVRLTAEEAVARLAAADAEAGTTGPGREA